MALLARARASLIKALSMLAFGIGVFGHTAYNASHGLLPHAPTMGWIGTLALIANLSVAVLLYRFREGDSNMRSVWLCTRNDLIGNIMVLAAALGVFASDTLWPDFIVALIMASLAVHSAILITRQSLEEIARKDA